MPGDDLGTRGRDHQVCGVSRGMKTNVRVHRDRSRLQQVTEGKADDGDPGWLPAARYTDMDEPTKATSGFEPLYEALQASA